MPPLAMAMILAGAVSTGDVQRARPMQPLGSYFSADDYPSLEGGVQEGILLAQPSARPPAPTPAPDASPLRPTAWPFRLFTDEDYPPAALRAREQGRVVYRIEIGPDGRVSGCAVRWSSGSASLDATTCRILRSRARFAPSRDSAGRPVPDHRDGDVLWRLPGWGEGED